MKLVVSNWLTQAYKVHLNLTNNHTHCKTHPDTTIKNYLVDNLNKNLCCQNIYYFKSSTN